MPCFRKLVALSLFSAFTFSVGCGGGSSTSGDSGSGSQGNPVPAITSLSPIAVAVGSAAFTLDIKGSNFITTSTVKWGGSNRTTQFVSAGELKASISASDISRGGNVAVTVTNPSPGGGSSPPSTFVVGVVGSPPASHTDWRYIGATVDAGEDTFATPTYLAYDQPRSQLFLSVPRRNLVLVFDTRTHLQKGQIYVPTPLGIDLTADGSTLYVGTGTNFLYAIDPASLRTKRIINTLDLLSGGFASVSLVTLSDGRLVILPTGSVDGSPSLILFDPSTTSVTTITPPDWAWLVTRSANHRTVLIASPFTSSSVSLFNAPTNQLISVSLPHEIVMRVAANPMRDEYAVADEKGDVDIYDSQLNHLGSFQTEPGIISNNLSGMVFSGDGAKLHLFVEASIREYDANSFQQTGFMDQPYTTGTFVGSLPFMEDNNGIILGVNQEGLDFIDTAPIAMNRGKQQPNGYGYNLVPLAPATGSIEGGILATTGIGASNAQLSAPPVSQVYLGNRPVWSFTSDPTNFSVIVPSGAQPGAADLLIQVSDGALKLAPAAFSYGPEVVRLVSTAAPAEESAPGYVAGYGLGSDPSALQITIAGKPASVTTIYNSPPGLLTLPTPLQTAIFTIPKGNPGLADVTVTTPNGSTTVAKAFRYTPPSTLYSSPASLQAGVYDSRRHLIYYTDSRQIQVFSTASKQWQAPIPVPQAGTASLVGVSISPGGNFIAVSDQGNRAVIIINPDLPSSAQAFPVSDGGFGLVPAGLAVTNEGIIYFQLGFPFAKGPGYRCQTGLFWKLDTSTGQATDLNPAPNDWCADPQSRVLLTPDESLVFVDADGALQTYDTASGTLFYAGGGGFVTSDMALSSDGSRLIENSGVIDMQGNFLGFPAWSDLDLSDQQDLRYGEKLDQDGGLLLHPWSNALDLLDLGHLIAKDRVALPVPVLRVFDSLTWDGDDDLAFMIVDGGILEVPLAPMPLVLASVSPNTGSSGTAVTLYGSGFTATMTATVDDAVVPVNFEDEHTATIVMPAHAAGGVRIELATADSQTSFLDAVFTYSHAASRQERKAEQKWRPPVRIPPLRFNARGYMIRPMPKSR